MSEEQGPGQLPAHDQLEQAIAEVAGVAAATVNDTGPEGSARLRVRLAADADPDVVAAQVASTLERRFGLALDPDAIRQVLSAGPPSSASGIDQHAPPRRRTSDHQRATIRQLSIDRDGDRFQVRAELAHLARSAVGEVAGSPGTDPLVVVARATLAAVDQLFPATGLDGLVEHVQLDEQREPGLVSVVLRLGDPPAALQLVGSSLVHDDHELAVMKATLDALNRRVEPLFDDPA